MHVTPIESHSLGAILLNNCVRACLSHTLGDSHALDTRVSKELYTDMWLLF